MDQLSLQELKTRCQERLAAVPITKPPVVKNPIKNRHPRVPCPDCHGLHTQKRGYTFTGFAKLYCKDCQRSYVNKSQTTLNFVPRKPRITCPQCNSKNTQKQGYTPAGFAKLYCKDCQRWYISKSQTTLDFVPREPRITCPKCNSKNTQKKGMDRYKRSQIYCKDCQRYTKVPYQINHRVHHLKQC